jgi:hypothetical protein
MRPLIANVVDAIRSSSTSRGISVRQMRWQTRSALAHQRSIRRAAGRAIRQALQRHRAAVIGSLRAAFTGSGPPEPATVWEAFPPKPGEDDREADRTFELLQVVRVIQNHPEGVCARDIGNELGIDWRRVRGMTRSLVDSGLVDQVEQTLYPAATPRRR